MIIKTLLLEISSLNRVGQFTAKALSRLIGGNNMFNLLLHKPISAQPISISPKIYEIKDNELVIVKATVESHIKPTSSRQPFKVVCHNPSGYINLVFFKIFPGLLHKMPIGTEIAILGQVTRSFVGKKMEFQIVHPQEIIPASEIDKLPKLNVVYPLSAGVSQKFLSRKIKEILKKIGDDNEEWIDQSLFQQRNWCNFSNALKSLHYFSNSGQESYDLARKRLAYDELLAWQIAKLMAKNNNTQTKKYVKCEHSLAQDFISTLPFEPTNAQIKAILEVSSEINSKKKMLRLLQGDVGSGKTIVAISSCLEAIGQGKQACVIVPITILAKQHNKYFRNLLAKLDINIEILTSATTKKAKTALLKNLESGEIDILIGTHAILEDDVKFKDLGLAIIDEQHRFGVLQRLKLVEKGEDVDTLLMSATPIPRSLMMGLYGDMDISVLDEKPKDRLEIETLVRSAKKVSEMYDGIKRALKKGEKIYWICPAIEKPEETKEDLFQEDKLTSAKEKHKELCKVFGEDKVRLIHGKMKEKEKEAIMAEFKEGEGEILVATTVIEVGIDISNATIIVIENSEHFGLSQLHQLRGRVGRSDKKSYCILLYGEKFGAKSRQRLSALKKSNDGFYIAEEDLKMRGSGELLGTKQSGCPEFRIADLSLDTDLLKIANQNAKVILGKDPKLKERKYQELLQLFSYDDCLKIISSG